MDRMGQLWIVVDDCEWKCMRNRWVDINELLIMITKVRLDVGYIMCECSFAIFMCTPVARLANMIKADSLKWRSWA